MNKAVTIGIIVVIAAVGIGLASPLFYETEVDESLPVALDNIEPGLTFEKFTSMDERKRQGIVEKMPNKVKDMIMDKAASTQTKASESMDEMKKDSTKNQITILKQGIFEGLAGHQAQGLAKIIQVDDSSFLRFEDFQVTNGPDLRVYITQNGDVKQGIHLEKLKGSKGNQNYSIDDVDIEVYSTVVIYCQPFGAYFGQAEMG